MWRRELEEGKKGEAPCKPGTSVRRRGGTSRAGRRRARGAGTAPRPRARPRAPPGILGTRPLSAHPPRRTWSRLPAPPPRPMRPPRATLPSRSASPTQTGSSPAARPPRLRRRRRRRRRRYLARAAPPPGRVLHRSPRSRQQRRSRPSLQVLSPQD